MSVLGVFSLQSGDYGFLDRPQERISIKCKQINPILFVEHVPCGTPWNKNRSDSSPPAVLQNSSVLQNTYRDKRRGREVVQPPGLYHKQNVTPKKKRKGKMTS
jgi:hypothetical protein